jgi:hypothetical protein
MSAGSFHSSSTSSRKKERMQDEESMIKQALEDEDKLADVMTALAKRMQEGYVDGTTPMHAPHGLLILAHKYYHECFEPMLEQTLETLATEVNVEVEDLPDSAHTSVHEGVLRRLFVSLFLLGIEAERMSVFKTLHTCDCGEVDDSSLERFIDECTHD